MSAQFNNLIEKLKANYLEHWLHEDKLYIQGDARQICRCLESTRAKRIKHNDYEFEMWQIVRELNGRGDIKISIDAIIE